MKSSKVCACVSLYVRGYVYVCLKRRLLEAPWTSKANLSSSTKQTSTRVPLMMYLLVHLYDLLVPSRLSLSGAEWNYIVYGALCGKMLQGLVLVIECYLNEWNLSQIFERNFRHRSKVKSKGLFFAIRMPSFWNILSETLMLEMCWVSSWQTVKKWRFTTFNVVSTAKFYSRFCRVSRFRSYLGRQRK